MIKQPTSFKNLENPTWIDQILTNHPKRFPSSSVFEMTDFHKLTLTALKPKIIQYRDFNHFNNVLVELLRGQIVHFVIKMWNFAQRLSNEFIFE